MIDEGVKRWIPGSVRPDVIEKPVVRDSEAGANGCFAATKGIISKTDARTVVTIGRFPHAGHWADNRCADGCRTDSAQVRELGDEVMRLRRRAITFPS